MLTDPHSVGAVDGTHLYKQFDIMTEKNMIKLVKKWPKKYACQEYQDDNRNDKNKHSENTTESPHNKKIKEYDQIESVYSSFCNNKHEIKIADLDNAKQCKNDTTIHYIIINIHVQGNLNSDTGSCSLYLCLRCGVIIYCTN